MESTQKETTVEGQRTDESQTEERLFDPPLYKQRYHAVVNCINQVKAFRVIDIGCSEGQFLPVIKSMCPNVEEIYGVDIDRALLERMKFRLQPLTIEYVLKRETPLTMYLMHGSITQPDLRFFDVDFVACIEVIEHLLDDDLRKVPDALFGTMRPKVVAITTPNSEYNVLFKNFSGMRHWDHKFEWTRHEFENWCRSIEKSYPYTVEFSGIGEPPEENRSVGCCSQMALFTRAENIGDVSTRTTHTSEYEVIHSVVYPHDNIDRETKILNEIQYLVNRFYSGENENDTMEELTRFVLITELLQFPGLLKLDVSKVEAVDVLRNSDVYKLDECGENLVLTLKLSDFRFEDDSYNENDNGLNDENDVVSFVGHLNDVQEHEEEWDV